MGRNHRSPPGGAGVDPQRGGAAKKNLDPEMQSGVSFLASLRPSRREVDLSAAHLELEWQNPGIQNGAPRAWRAQQRRPLPPPDPWKDKWTATLSLRTQYN